MKSSSGRIDATVADDAQLMITESDSGSALGFGDANKYDGFDASDSATGLGEGGNGFSCTVDEDCERFGTRAFCHDGGCSSTGLRCAQDAGIDGAMQTENGSAAAVFQEWMHIAYQHVSRVCDHRYQCEDTLLCHEPGLEAADSTCCANTLDFFLENREQLLECEQPIELDCNRSVKDICPIIWANSFESLCSD